MAELVPILGGLLTGFAIGRGVSNGRTRLALMAATSVAIGVFAGVVSGELAESWAFLAIDIPGAFIAQVVAVFALDRLGAAAAAGRPPN